MRRPFRWSLAGSAYPSTTGSERDDDNEFLWPYDYAMEVNRNYC